MVVMSAFFLRLESDRMRESTDRVFRIGMLLA